MGKEEKTIRTKIWGWPSYILAGLIFTVASGGIDPGKIQGKLKNLGAKKSGEYFQRWKTFDYPDLRLDKEGAWVRLRDEGDGKITLSFKKRLGMKDREGTINDTGMEEVEICASDFDKTALIFEKIGFVEKHYAEKKRIRWEKDKVKFDIDFYPELEPYLEIEAGSWEDVYGAIDLLGLDKSDKKIFPANQVYAAKGIQVEKLKRITFAEGLIERKEV